jgi:hypothetical protein
MSATSAAAIELVATADLIQELLGRKTFLGVLVHVQGEIRAGVPQNANGQVNFCVRASSDLSQPGVIALLEAAADTIREAPRA